MYYLIRLSFEKDHAKLISLHFTIAISFLLETTFLLESMLVLCRFALKLNRLKCDHYEKETTLQ